MDRDKLDPKGLEAATNAVEQHFMLDGCGTAKQCAEIAVTAYLSVLHDRAARQYAELLAILDNPQPPTDALRKLYRDYAPLLSHTRAAAPSGWKCVPDDLTEDMINAGIASLGSDDDRSTAEKVLDVYRAMLNASPSPGPA